MTQRRRRLGALGEDAAAGWYEANGYTVVERNWRVKDGEVDLICERGSTIVFVEVKTRSSSRFGTAAEAVTPAKQARLRRLGMLWLRSQGRRYREVRFDVVDSDPRGHLKIYEAAF